MLMKSAFKNKSNKDILKALNNTSKRLGKIILFLYPGIILFPRIQQILEEILPVKCICIKGSKFTYQICLQTINDIDIQRMHIFSVQIYCPFSYRDLQITPINSTVILLMTIFFYEIIYLILKALNSRCCRFRLNIVFVEINIPSLQTQINIKTIAY